MSKKQKYIRISLFALCLMTAVLVLAACAANEHTHTYGEWNESVATCETAGQRSRVCGECGKAESETIKPLGHLWDDGVVSRNATCEDRGLMKYTCTRADCKKTRDEEINQLGHDWQAEEVLVSATCETQGMSSAVCSRCDARDAEHVIPALDHKWDDGRETLTPDCEHSGEKLYQCTRDNCTKSKTEPIDALGHLWSDWKNETAATCTEQGSEVRACVRVDCMESQRRITNAIGHKWSNDYIVDEAPTYEHDGVESKHCTNIGCNETKESQSIPRLEVTYIVYVKDSCGSYYYGNATLEFYVKGELVETAPLADSRVNTLSLHSPECNVKVTGLNKGYSANAEGYDLTEAQPVVTVCLSAAVMDAPKEALPFYKTGSVLYDQEYTYYGANNVLETTTLKDILAVKKGIIMNFYFNGCSPCNNEMQGLINISRVYQDDIAIIMVNYYDTEKDLLAFRDRHNAADTPLMFLNVDSSKYTFRDFASVVKAFPTSAFIDCNGQVVTMPVGGMTQSAFDSYIKSYILNRYDILHPTQTNSFGVTSAAEVILPSKRFWF